MTEMTEYASGTLLELVSVRSSAFVSSTAALVLWVC